MMYQHSDKFYAAIRILAGKGPIKKRLATAYDEHLLHLPIEERPKCIRQRFEKLRRIMLAVKPLGSESPVLATVRKMSEADANRCANQILAMFSEQERITAITRQSDQPANGTQNDNLTVGSYRSLN